MTYFDAELYNSCTCNLTATNDQEIEPSIILGNGTALPVTKRQAIFQRAVLS
jgi:hypothetical protein